MASKKEHKRKQKNKNRQGDGEGSESPIQMRGPELNALDLLSVLHGVPKASEGDRAGEDGVTREPESPVNERKSKPAHKSETRETEAADKARREAEEKEQARRAAEEAERRRLEAETAAKARREAEEKEQARRAAEEAERRRLEAEAAAKARREAEEKEQARRAAEEAERRRLEAEAAAKARREAEEKEQARRVAEEAERRRLEAEAAAKARREAEGKEQARRVAEEAERRHLEAEAVAKARREAEKVERERRVAEEAERLRREAAREELLRQQAKAAERARKMAEEVECARLAAEAAERRRREAIEAERRQQEDAARERARAMAAEAADRHRRADGPAERSSYAAAVPPVPPPLEVENPYWEKTPEIFEMLSGAPHAATPSYMDSGSDREGSLPVTMTVERARQGRIEPGYYDEAVSDGVPEGEPRTRTTIPVPMEKRMYIVMVTPEVAPCAKVGGLGDVVLGLGRELMKRGHGVEVICPMYSGMRYDLIENLHEEYSELWCPHYDEWRAEKVFQGTVGGCLQVNFISGGGYTERPNIYGYEDDLQRFTYFSRQALEFMYKTNRRPDIIHCHDWATGLVPAALWDIYEKLGWDNSRVVYTIHNNECQGLCGFPDKLLGLIGLDAKKYLSPDKMQDDSHRNCVNMMKGGIVFSNFVTTVSPTYAGELKTVAGGRGLQTTIAKNSAKVGGVLNGIDYDTWNPRTDAKITARYGDGDDFYEKYRNKGALREWLGLWDSWKPIISVVTRLTHQKGLDLIKHALWTSQKLQAQFVLLGSAPDPRVNNEFLALQNQLKDNHDVNLYIGYHEDLSRLIYAGSDMFLVPSLYEPCGLTQMISLRYGTVPIVRETGGLVDTVFDLDNSGLGLNKANGFTFRDPTPVSLDYGLERAVRLWYDNPDAFNRLARNGMQYDYSWCNPTEHYENIYNYIKA